MKWIIGAAAVVLININASAAEDALAQYDDLIVSSVITDECHLVIPGTIAEGKLHALGQTAWHQIWTSLDEQNGAEHDQNGHKAEFTLRKRTEADMERGRDLVTEKGCSALTPAARATLEPYAQNSN